MKKLLLVLALIPLSYFGYIVWSKFEYLNDNIPEDQLGEDLSINQEFYQLKIYDLESVAQESVVDSYLRDAFLPGLKRLGFENIGVFKVHPNDVDSVQKIYVLIPFEELNQFQKYEGILNADSLYVEKGKAYLSAAHDNPPYKRIESILLKAFKDFSTLQPNTLDGPRSERIYELRSYESPSEEIYRNKVHMFNEGGEIKLFKRLGFNAVFYADVISGPSMPNLMYMTTFTDQKSRDEHWKSFVDAPEWKKMSSDPFYANNVSHADIYFLYPTEYSDY